MAVGLVVLVVAEGEPSNWLIHRQAGDAHGSPWLLILLACSNNGVVTQGHHGGGDFTPLLPTRSVCGGLTGSQSGGHSGSKKAPEDRDGALITPPGCHLDYADTPAPHSLWDSPLGINRMGIVGTLSKLRLTCWKSSQGCDVGNGSYSTPPSA